MAKYSYLIGKEIEWKDNIDQYRGSYLHHSAKVIRVSGRNILVDEAGSMDWKWIPFMHDIAIKESEEEN
jgi:hypothetical protein